MLLPPDLHSRDALFLDFDGTLVDIAPTPEAVHVAPSVVPALQTLHERLGGALAIVTGRPITDIDHFLAPLRPAVAGVHGAERRRNDGSMERAPVPSLEPVARAAQAVAAAHRGVHVEVKGLAVTLHYRQAPQCEALCLAAMQHAVERLPGLRLMTGKMIVEVLPAGVGKGLAVEAFLREAPFAGRRPVFVGDDVTDEAGIAAAQAAGGIGVKVGPGDSVAQHRLHAPRAVLEWLGAAQVRHA